MTAEVQEAFAETLEELRAKQAAALTVIAKYPQVAAEVYAAMESAVADAQAAAAMQANQRDPVAHRLQRRGPTGSSSTVRPRTRTAART